MQCGGHLRRAWIGLGSICAGSGVTVMATNLLNVATGLAAT